MMLWISGTVIEWAGMKEFLKRIKEKISPSILIFVITLMVAVFYVGFAAGAMVESNTNGQVSIGDLVNRDNRDFYSEDVDFNLFWQVWDVVKESYLEQPVPDLDLFYGSLHGMVEGLNDPYSVFFDPEETEEFNQDLDGTFFGIGAEIGMRDDVVVVEAPLPNSPASQAGVLAGDIILAVDGEDTFGWSVYDAVQNIRGERGVPVTLTLLAESDDQPRDIVIVRDEIVIDSVEWEIRDDEIAIVSVSMFNSDTNRLFNQAVQDILRENPQGLIIDVRNNRGGLLDAVIRMADFWIDDDVVVVERMKDSEFTLQTNPGSVLADIPTVVLINGGSASASEILAGALQDYGLATLIGQTSFGKGVVQEYQEFSNGSAVKITVAEWLTPKGRAINEVGIEPDIQVEFTVDDFNEGKTPQLDAAIDYLTGR